MGYVTETFLPGGMSHSKPHPPTITLTSDPVNGKEFSYGHISQQITYVPPHARTSQLVKGSAS